MPACKPNGKTGRIKGAAWAKIAQTAQNLHNIVRFMQKIKIILNMHNNGFTVEQIAMATDKNVEEVKAIIAGKEPALA